MNINRDNYETFFLLYTDNELSAAEKKAVNDFVHANPDLEEELLMLQQSVCKPDNVLFDGKQSLLKNESEPSGLQENLLSLLDNELSTQQAAEINLLIKDDAALQKEWAILQQTKLVPEKIIFKDKASLYRKEGGRVIAFPWKRLAIAAALTGIAAWGLVNLLDKESNGNTEILAGKNSGSPAKIIATPKKVVPAKEQNTLPVIEAQAVPDALLATTQQEDAPTNATNRVATIVTKKQVPVVPLAAGDNNKTMMAATHPEKKNNTLSSSENLNNNSSNNTVAANVKPPKQPIINGNNDIGTTMIEQGPANMYASTTAFTETEENNDRVLFMDEEKIKKTKLGGIFKKVKRVFERSTNINTGGNHLKVANLEFAIQ